MYKYIGIDERSSMQTRVLENDISIREFPRNLRADIKTKKIFQFCNPPNEIIAETEGTINITHVIILTICCSIKQYNNSPFSTYRKIGWKSNIEWYFSIYKTRGQRAISSHSKHKHSKLWRRFWFYT